MGDRAENHLLDARAENSPYVLDVPDAATVGERHPALRGQAFDQLEWRRIAAPGRADIEERDLVHLEAVEEVDDIDRIAQVAWRRETHCLHHGLVVHEETRDDAGSRHPLGEGGSPGPWLSP